MNNDLIAVIANVALSLSFIVAVIFGIAQVKAAARDRQERLTLEALRSFQTRDFAELIHYVTRTEIPATLEGLLKISAAEQVLLIQLGQQMESLGILVADHYINIDLVDKTLGSFVTVAWEKYQPLFQDIRDNQPDPFLGEYFQWLAEQIDERLKKNPRTPFFKSKASVHTGHRRH